MHFEFFLQTFSKKMDKIPLQIGLLLFFISLIIFSRNGLDIKDILFRSLIISLAVTILVQITILFLAKSLSRRPVNTDNNKKTAKESPEGH